MDPADIEDLFDQLEDYSDSGPDADTISIGSTPKPSLKPFFCSSRNLLHEARSVVAAAAVVKAQSKSKSYYFHEKKNETFFEETRRKHSFKRELPIARASRNHYSLIVTFSFTIAN